MREREDVVRPSSPAVHVLREKYSRSEPPVVKETLLGRLLVLPVPLGDVRASNVDFPGGVGREVDFPDRANYLDFRGGGGEAARGGSWTFGAFGGVRIDGKRLKEGRQRWRTLEVVFGGMRSRDGAVQRGFVK